MQRHQGDEHEIGKGDPRHAHGEREFFRIRLKARARSMRRSCGVKAKASASRTSCETSSKREYLAGETAWPRSAPSRRKHARIGRDIGGVEGALAEYRAKLVGKLESDDERVVHRAGAEYRAEREIAAQSRSRATAA